MAGRHAGGAGRLGADPRRLPGHRGLAGVHFLRRAAGEEPRREGHPHGPRPPEVVRERLRHDLQDLGAFLLGGLPPGRPGHAQARQVNRARRFISELVWEGDFDGRFEDREHAIEAFERHNEEVKRRVPPEKLLVYEVKQGWGPLCDFLGVEAPDKPFPHLNDGEAFRDWVRRIRLFTTAALAVGVSLAGLVVLRLSRRRRR